MKRIIAILILTAALSMSAIAQNGWLQMNVKDLIGNTHKLSDFASDKGVTLFVFWKTCCPNNITMIEDLNDILLGYDDDECPIKVVLVSVDDQRTASRVRPIVSSHGWEWEVIMDRNGDLARSLNIIMPPQWIAFDPKGNTIFRSKITNGDLDPAIYFKEMINQINKTN